MDYGPYDEDYYPDGALDDDYYDDAWLDEYWEDRLSGGQDFPYDEFEYDDYYPEEELWDYEEKDDSSEF